MASPGQLIVVAAGGNSLIQDETKQTVPDQYAAVERTCCQLSALLEAGNRLVITHGNGPQVGFIMRRGELAAHELHLVPFDSCGADTQGAIGYQIQLAMYNCMRDWPERRQVATVVTQVLVDGDDPAFAKPSKPIGSFMDEATATARCEQYGWDVVEDAGRGFRRVVPSPAPHEIIELDAIKALLAQGFVVVAAGGGGIPVKKNPDGSLTGVEAVIDKDFASALLAEQIGADLLLISTAVDQVCLNFGKPEQVAIARMTVAEAESHIAAGQFAPGSMLPKIRASVQFVRATGKAALITTPANLGRAIAGETGTRVVP